MSQLDVGTAEAPRYPQKVCVCVCLGVGWCVRLFRGLPLSPRVSAFVGWWVLLEVLSAFENFVSRSLPLYVPPLFDGVTGLPAVLSPSLSAACLPSLVSRLVSQLGWCVRLPEALSLLCPSFFPSLSCLSACLRSFLFPLRGWCVHLPLQSLVS